MVGRRASHPGPVAQRRGQVRRAGETIRRQFLEGLLHRQVPEGFARWLAALPPEEPFFAWVHLLETHLPYGATGYCLVTLEDEPDDIDITE